MKRIIAVVMFLIFSFTLTSCGKKEYIPYSTQADDTLLIDYCDAVVGTESDRGSFEILLKVMSDRYAVLETVTNAENEGEAVIVDYKISVDAVNEIRKSIEETDMANWHKHEEYGPIDGRALMCKFKYGEEYITVNADHMPSDGQKDFYAVKEAMLRYAKPEYIMTADEN